MKTVVIELSTDEAEYLVAKLTGGAEAAPNDTERFWMAKMRDRVKDAILSRDAVEAEQLLRGSTLPVPPGLPPPPPGQPFGLPGAPQPASGVTVCKKQSCSILLPHPAH